MPIGRIGGIVPVLLVGLGLAGAAMAAKPKKKKKCAPFKWQPVKVRGAVSEQINLGERDAATITFEVAIAVYPTDPITLQPNQWPERPTSGHRCVWDRIVVEVQEQLKDAPPIEDEEEEEEEDEGPTIADMLDELISSVPRGGKYYLVKKDDSASAIARAVLNSVKMGAGKSNQNRLSYIHCVTGGPGWNRPLYGSTKTTKRYPAYYAVDGITMWAAFMPRNKSAVRAILQGDFPERNIGDAGQKLGPGAKFGLLWLPPVDRAALDLGEVTCGTIEWPDGSSSIDPPPEFLDKLEGG